MRLWRKRRRVATYVRLVGIGIRPDGKYVVVGQTPDSNGVFEYDFTLTNNFQRVCEAARHIVLGGS